jgi:ABC-2 type transport system ATP-binding protein
MAMMVEVEGLTKVFVKSRSLRELALKPFTRGERITAIEDVNLNIGQGEILGLLGPNGAGKTTLLKILTGLLVPTRGQGRVAGYDVVRDPTRVRLALGFVTSEERSFYWRLSGRENLHFFGRLSNLTGAGLRSRCQELLERVELDDAADRRFMTYSSGMKQRLAVARALLHDPRVVIMDEPTRSLDPSSARHLRRFIQEELSGRQGKTILLATHNLEEAESVCGRIAIISRSRIRRVGTVEEIRAAESPLERYRVVLNGALSALGKPYRIVDHAALEGSRWEYTLEVDRDGEGLTCFLREALDASCRVVSCRRLEMALQEVFDRVVQADGEPE